MPNPNETTGRLAYAKLLVLSKLFRGGFVLGSSLANLFGSMHPMSIDPRQLTGGAIDISSSKSRRQIRVMVYRNEAAISAEKKGGKSAVNIHWRGMDTSTHHTPDLALHHRAPLFPTSGILSSHNHRRDICSFPEYPCPAELEDARDVYNYVIAHQYKWDINRISLSGNSSGGSIALGLAVTLGKEAREASQGNAWVHPIKAVVAYYALTSWIGISEKTDAFIASLPEDSPFMHMGKFVLDTIAAAHFFCTSGSAAEGSGANEKSDQKGPTGAARKETLQRLPMVSPALAALRDFPPRVGMWNVEWGVLRPDADELRERLQGHSFDGKGGVSGRTIKGVGHGWDLEARQGQAGWEEKEEAYQDLVKAIAWVGGLNVT